MKAAPGINNDSRRDYRQQRNGAPVGVQEGLDALGKSSWQYWSGAYVLACY